MPPFGGLGLRVMWKSVFVSYCPPTCDSDTRLAHPCKTGRAGVRPVIPFLGLPSLCYVPKAALFYLLPVSRSQHRHTPIVSILWHSIPCRGERCLTPLDGQLPSKCKRTATGASECPGPTLRP